MSLLRKTLRIVAGAVLVLVAGSFFMEGGLSRYAQHRRQHGFPAHSDWRLIAIGFVLAGAGGVLLRPIKKWGR